MTYGQKLMSRPGPKPNTIQAISADQVDKTRTIAFFDMFERLLGRNTPAEPFVNFKYCFSQEQTAEIVRVIRATIGITTNTKIHDP